MEREEAKSTLRFPSCWRSQSVSCGRERERECVCVSGIRVSDAINVSRVRVVPMVVLKATGCCCLCMDCVENRVIVSHQCSSGT